MDICIVPDCEKSLRSPGAIYCKMHYHRWYRHGSPDKVSNRSRVSASLGRRYKRIRAVGHPVADATGNAYAHRVVLYDTAGGLDLPCHYCGALLKWSSTRGDKDVLQVDHLNDDGGDNRPENLVACCSACNTAKAMARRHEAYLAAGYWAANDTVAALRSPDQKRRVFDLSQVVPAT